MSSTTIKNVVNFKPLVSKRTAPQSNSAARVVPAAKPLRAVTVQCSSDRAQGAAVERRGLLLGAAALLGTQFARDQPAEAAIADFLPTALGGNIGKPEDLRFDEETKELLVAMRDLVDGTSSNVEADVQKILEAPLWVTKYKTNHGGRQSVYESVIFNIGPIVRQAKYCALEDSPCEGMYDPVNTNYPSSRGRERLSKEINEAIARLEFQVAQGL